MLGDKRVFLFAAFLSVMFTVAFFFLMLESVRVVDELLLRFFPSLPWQRQLESLRPLFYVAFGVTLVLMLLGIIVDRGYLSAFSSIAMYLPVFGYFALTMIPLAGIGVIRALWLPIIDFSPSLLRLGDIVYVPYNILSSLPGIQGYVNIFPIYTSLPGIYMGKLSFILMGTGVFIFFLGVLTWIYGKFRGREIVDFWIYKVSRHPQYFGFLLWSYGMLTLAPFLNQLVWRFEEIPEPSLPWLVSALTIIAVALNEEIKMVKKHGEKYSKYRSSTPFMLPLPKILSRLITVPVKILLKKNLPENRKEIAYITLIYGVTLILLSVFFV